MFPALSSTARVTAFLIALAALVSLALRFIWEQQVTDATPAESVWAMLRYFTILTNGLVVITFLVAAFRRNGVGEAWIAALTLWMVLVGAVYHVLLAGLVEFIGIGFWSDHGMHTVVPIACLLWWLAFAPKQTLVYSDMPMFLLWPAVYVAYALGRAAADNVYPYPFMDLNVLSAAAVAANLAGLLLVLMLGGVIFVMIARFADR